MKLRVLQGLGVLAVAAGALALRLPRLDQRPMHTDEAVQAIKSGLLLETGKYTFDPNEFHGPLLHYLALPSMWLTAGRDFAATHETTFRLVTALCGGALVLLHLLLWRGLGRWAAWTAAVFCALSPAMVFYCRYYIPETLLVMLTLATILSGWRYAQSGRLAWAILTGLLAGLMYATKETSVLVFAAMAAALAVLCAWRRWSSSEGADLRSYLAPRVLAISAATAFVAAFLLYSAFFTNMSGPLDSLRTYAIWSGRGASGSVHDHPWYYYLQLLLYVKYPYGPTWSQGLIVGLALIGLVAAVTGKGLAQEHLPLARFFALYTAFMTAGYAIIPYKTPWCMLGFLQGMCVLGGIGFAAVLAWRRRLPVRTLAMAVLLAGAAHLALQSWRASFELEADRRNPYVYAHPTRDVVRLGEVVSGAAAVSPEGRDMLVRVITPDYWPLPWYFRKLRRVGYWDEPPADVDAGAIITSPELAPAVEARQKRSYRKMSYGLRPTVVLMVYIRSDLWSAWLERSARHGGTRP
jgi:uncharacterized protein (TIGR03663 family)